MQWKLLRRPKTHYITFVSLIRYKESFTQLKSLKTEIEHLQHLLEKAKVKMQKDFEIWWAEQAAFNQVWIETTLRSMDSGFHAVDSRFQVLDSWFSYQWNFYSGLKSLVGFRIPLAKYRIPQEKISRIPDSTSPKFPDSGIWITLRTRASRFLRIYIHLTCATNVLVTERRINGLFLVSNKQLYSLVKPSSIRCCDSGYDDCFCVNTKAHCSVGHKFCNGRQRRKLSKTVFPLLGVTHLCALIYKT